MLYYNIKEYAMIFIDKENQLINEAIKAILNTSVTLILLSVIRRFSKDKIKPNKNL